jgi:iron complex outermembrane recepter protein
MPNPGREGAARRRKRTWRRSGFNRVQGPQIMRFVTLLASPLALAVALSSAHAAEAPVPAAAPDAAAPAGGDGDTDINTITVTARHRNEKLGDVPLAISTASGKDLALEHLDRVADYTLKIPNFYALQQNTRVSALTLRGVGGNASNDGAESGVGLIVDNVFFTYVGFSWLDFVDLEGIEVVRGPQGTLLGKNTTIGAVIVKTQKPSFDPSLNVSATVGDRGIWQLRANATGALIKDKLAFRLTAATSQGGGWIPNADNGIKLLNNNRWSVRGQLLFTPSTNVTDRLIVEHYETHEYNNFYPPVADVNQNLNPNTGAVVSTRASWYNKLVNYLGYTPSLKGPFNADMDTQGRLTSRTDGVSNELDVDFGKAELTAVTAWRRLYFRPHNDGDYTPLPIDGYGYNVDVDQYSQEVRLASKGNNRFDWQAGVYYLHEWLRSNLQYQFGSDAAAFILSPALPSSVLNGVTYDKDGHLRVDSVAGFGQGTYHFTDTLTLTAGLRYTQEQKTVNVYGYSGGGAALGATYAPYRAAVLASFGGTTSAAAGNYTDSGHLNSGTVSWLVNPSWKINENVLLYASASFGEKSGAANTSASGFQQSVILTKPEKSLDFEAGVKTNWDHGRYEVNLNFYNNTITDYQAAQVDPNNAGIGNYLANVGKVRMRGFELETSAHPIPALSLNVNAAYNDAVYLSYDNAPAPVEYQAYLGGASAVLPLTGYRLAGAPRWTVQGGPELDQPLGDGSVHLVGYANATWKSSIAYINPRSIYGWQAPYAVVNAGLGIKTPDGSWTATVWSKNLFNKYYAAAYAAATSITPVIEIMADPRTFGLTVSHRF